MQRFLIKLAAINVLVFGTARAADWPSAGEQTAIVAAFNKIIPEGWKVKRTATNATPAGWKAARARFCISDRRHERERHKKLRSLASFRLIGLEYARSPGRAQFIGRVYLRVKSTRRSQTARTMGCKRVCGSCSTILLTHRH